MFCRKGRLLIPLITCLMALILVACSHRGDVADINSLPFPREQVTNRWRVDGATLIERTYDYSRGYYLQRQGETKIIIGEAYDLEFRRNANGRLYFTAHRWIDSMWMSFPYLRWYNIRTEAEGTEKVYLGMAETGYWGQPGSDRLLSDFRIAGNDLEFTFGVKKEAVSKFYGNPPWYFPFTKAAFNMQTREIVFCFYQTEAKADVFQAANDFKARL